MVNNVKVLIAQLSTTNIRICVKKSSNKLNRNLEYCTCTYFDGLLDHVVDDEQHKDDLASEDEIVAWSDVAQKFDGAERPWRNNASSSRQLRHQSTHPHINMI